MLYLMFLVCNIFMVHLWEEFSSAFYSLCSWMFETSFLSFSLFHTDKVRDLFFLFLEHHVFQTPKRLSGCSLTNSFIPVFLEYWGDQNGNDTLDAAFLVPDGEEWLWPVGYTLSHRADMLHVFQDTLLKKVSLGHWDISKPFFKTGD